MMPKDNFDLMRVKSCIEEHPNSKIVIIARKREIAKFYWKKINQHIKIDEKLYIGPWFVSNNPKTMDGIPNIDTIVLKVGNWWENVNSIHFIENYSRLAKVVIPITNIPTKT